MELGVHFIDFLPGDPKKLAPTLAATAQAAEQSEREHLALGVPYPPVRAQMWSDNDGPYEGKHYQLAETLCVPQPIRRPPVPIGGDGEK